MSVAPIHAPPATLPVNSSVGARVKWHLDHRGWSLMTLHHKTVAADPQGEGVCHSTLSLLVRGKVHYPKARTIELIARAFDVPRAGLSPSTLDDSPGAAMVHEGVVLVPVVRLFATTSGHQETGETTPVPLSVQGEHARLLATRVNGGGLAPYVALGAVVIFDPDRDPRDRDPVIIDYLGSAHAAWYLEREDPDRGYLARYRLADGTTLERDDARLAGVFVGAFSVPPRYPGIG